MKLQPVEEFFSPTLTSYAHIPATGQIIARRVTEEPTAQLSPVKTKVHTTAISKQGDGSQKRKCLDEEGSGNEGDDGVCPDDADEEEEEDVDDDELDELDKLIAKKTTKPKTQLAKKKAKGAAKHKAPVVKS